MIPVILFVCVVPSIAFGLSTDGTGAAKQGITLCFFCQVYICVCVKINVNCSTLALVYLYVIGAVLARRGP